MSACPRGPFERLRIAGVGCIVGVPGDLAPIVRGCLQAFTAHMYAP